MTAETTSMVAFTIDDLQILSEAMESWVEKDAAGTMMTELVTAMLIKKDDPEYAKMMGEREIERARIAADRQFRKERSILIRAKLIQVMDERRAEQLIRLTAS